MAKPLKIFLGIVAALLLLVVGLAIAVPLLFDPNDYRDQISKAVKENTGREFGVADIKLHVFPWLRVGLTDATLGNAPGFGDEPFAQAGEARVGVRLLPLLFDRKLQVSTVSFTGLRLRLQRNAQGADNWSDIGKQKKEEPSPREPGKSEIDLDDIVIGGIEVKDSSLSYSDAQAKKEYQVDKLELSTGALRPGEPFDARLAFHARTSAPSASGEIELKGHVVPRVENQGFVVEELELKLKDGRLTPAGGQQIQADARLLGKLAVDLGASAFALEGLDLDADLSGASIPGGKQQLKLLGTLALDRAKGTLKFSDAELRAAGMSLKAQIAGEGINGDNPKLAGPVSVAPFKPRELLTALGLKLDTADPAALSEASLSAQYSGSFKSVMLSDLRLKLDQTNAQGSAGIRDFSTQALEFALKLDTIDADRYLAPKKTGPAGKGGKDDEPVRLPTEALEKLNASGTLDIGTLTLNGLKMSDVHIKLSGAKGAAKTQALSARLYGGKVALDNRISPGQRMAYALKSELSALDVAPFLRDLIDKDWVSGLGSIKLDLASSGGTVGEIKQGLNGDVSLRVENGVVKGFNLAQILRKSQSALQGNLGSAGSERRETDFSAVSFAARIVNGVIKSDSLDGSSPAFRLTGSGEIDLVRETIDYLINPTVVESSSGQGGKGLDQLRGLTIPIRLSGNLYEPRYRLDLNAALKQKGGEDLHKKYEEVEDRAKEKLRGKLNDFLFGKKKPQEAPQPAPAPEPAPAPQPPNT